MLANALTPWLGATNADALRYDATWGGLVSLDGLSDFMADFGMGWCGRGTVSQFAARRPKDACFCRRY